MGPITFSNVCKILNIVAGALCSDVSMFLITPPPGSNLKKEIICYANRIFMSFSPRSSVNFYCATLNEHALTCYATVFVM